MDSRIRAVICTIVHTESYRWALYKENFTIHAFAHNNVYQKHRLHLLSTEGWKNWKPHQKSLPILSRNDNQTSLEELSLFR